VSLRDGTVQHGNRVFWIDEECYIIYLGSEGHGVRPFLRIGTSPVLPQRIRRHIGSVIITDHLTGDLFDEDACLDPASPRTTRYVGGDELVDAVKHFVHREHIPSQALDPPIGEKPGKGGQVVYYEDGNVRVFLDGHRLFDLQERERADRHTVFRIQRVSEIIAASRGAYRSQEFSGTGFIVAPDGAALHFGDGNLFLADPHTERSVATWAWYGINPAAIVGIGSGTEPRRMTELYKFRLTSRHAVARSDAKTPDTPDRIRDAVTVFTAAGIDQEDFVPPTIPPDAPVPARDAETFVLPAKSKWYGDTAPPLLSGVPYRYEDYPSELEFRHLLTAELRHQIDAAATPDSALATIAARKTTHPIDRVLVALWIWNRLSGPGDHAEAELQQARTSVIEAFIRRDLPIVAVLRSDPDGWYVRFRPRDGLTRSAIADNDRARKKLTPLLETGDRSAQFQAERNRLTAFLEELLAAHRVTATPPVESTPARAATTAADSVPPKESATGGKTASPRNTAPGGKTVSSGTAAAPRKTGPSGQAAASQSATPENEEKEATEQTDSPDADSRKETNRSVGPNTRERNLMRPTLAAIVVVLLLLAGGAFWLTRSSGGDQSAEIAAGGADDATTGGRPGDSAPADGESSPDAGNNAGREESGTDTRDAGDPSIAAGESDAADATVSTDEADDTADATTGSDDSNGPDAPDTTGEPAAVAASESASGRESRTAADAAVITTDERWSVLDILRVTNWIAARNGYQRIGVSEFTDRPDPDWIFPGNTFRLPDGKIHTVITGETLWEISTGFLNRIFIASDMELAHFRDLIENEEYPVEELQN
jgi:hypothetical protein